MDASKLAPEDCRLDLSDVLLKTDFAMAKPADQRRLGCGDVARNRAGRCSRPSFSLV